MIAFVNALRSFQSGTLTQDALLTEVHRLLSVEKIAPALLMDELEIQHSARPLPPGTHAALISRIADWPLDPTVATDPSRSDSAWAREVNAPATVILSAAAARPAADSVLPSRGNRQAPTTGSILQGRFRLIKLIGEGGMSRVYKAIDLRRVEAGAEDPHVAVKVLTAPFSDYFGSIAALQREAHKLQSLTHPNIVRVMDCDRDGQSVFMTMEYLPGDPLNRRLMTARGAGAAMEPALGEGIVLAIAEALAYAHRNHIVHGDLKPGNVIVMPEGRVKVIDFGMARFIARPTDGKGGAGNPSTSPQPPALTPRYASPEMLAGRDPEPADDVYSLACVAYEIMSGAHPLERNGEAERDPQWRPPHPPGMSASRYRCFVHALAFDRNRRTASVNEFVEEFRDVARPVAPSRRPLLALGAAILAVIGLIYFLNHSGVRPTPVAAQLPAAIATGTVMRDCPTCPLLVVLPAGKFAQGSGPETAALPYERPQHPVSIAYPLAMSSNEVTVGEFQEFVSATQRPMNGCNTYDGQWQEQPDASWKKPGFGQSALHPVTCVSWDDASAFAAWLSKKSGHLYRLPSASEWEYAARAGSPAAQPWKVDGADACVNANVADKRAAEQFPGWEVFACNDGFATTAPVGSFKANAFGLNDMLGNVFEWTQDCWHDDYTDAPADGSARQDGNCKERELRGGSWFSAPAYVRAAYRNRFGTSYRSSSIGFRLVREMGR